MPAPATAATPLLAVTTGDPAGVGPELCLRLLAEESLRAVGVPLVFGDAAVLRAVAAATGLPAPAVVRPLAEALADPASVVVPTVADFGGLAPGDFPARAPSAVGGRASCDYVEAAIDAALAGKVAGIVTGPIHKEALSLAGVPFPGHTEILAARTGTDRYCMLLTSDEISCAFVTTHVGYRDVPGLLTVERIGEVLDLAAEALRRLRGREPRLVVCALNPHAGEHGLFGDREEERIIAPAVEAGRARGLEIEGPLPPDTAFLAWRRQRTDVFICMYHDQGHIPLKALAFDEAVNVTLGLPIVRTSVDHGTAYDQAWQGTAGPTSLFAAFRLAARLATERG